VLRLFITLFNLQGARRLAQLGYLTTFKILCQELFQSFFKLFRPLIRRTSFSCQPQLRLLGRRSREQLGYLTTQFRLCQALFSDFLNLFSSPRLETLRFDALSQALGYLNIYPLDCQPLLAC